MKSYKTLLFVALVIALLATICVFFPKGGLHVNSVQLHFPTLTKVLNPQRQMDLDAFLARKDSIQEELLNRQDSLKHFQHQLDSSDIRFWFPNNDDSFFDPLFAQFETAQSSGRIIRIVHYGDSQIEMDRMTNRLRAYMQGKFGGGGPGLVPFATLIPSLSVSTYGTGSLVRQSPFGDSIVVRAKGNYGPMVQDFYVGGSAVSTITAGTHRSCDQHLKHFSRVKMLFCNRPGPLKVTITDSKSNYTDSQSYEMEGVYAFEWRLDSATTSIRLKAEGFADIYGLMVDDGPGIAVDNIPMRGCSGQQFTQINQQQLTDAYSQMDVGLIILQFGGNSVPYLRSQKQIDTYCTQMGIQIDRLRQCCPKAQILFIGPSDMCANHEGEIQTYPMLPEMVKSLQSTVNAHGAAFWSIFHAMGGINSMPAWVSKGLGGADYIHFSQRGVDIMGDRLSQAFDNMYQLYKMKKAVKDVQKEQL